MYMKGLIFRKVRSFGPKLLLPIALATMFFPRSVNAGSFAQWRKDINPLISHKAIVYKKYEVKNQKKMVEQYFHLLVKVAGFWKDYCGPVEILHKEYLPKHVHLSPEVKEKLSKLIAEYNQEVENTPRNEGALTLERAKALQKAAEALLKEDKLDQAKYLMAQTLPYISLFLDDVRSLTSAQPPETIWETDGRVGGQLLEYAHMFAGIVANYFEYFPEVREMVTYGDSEGKDYWRKLGVQLKRLDAELKKPKPDLNLVLDHMTKAVKLLTLAPGTGHDESCSD